MSTTELVRTLRDLGFQGDVDGFIDTCDEDEIAEVILDLARTSTRVFDMSDLDDGGQVTLQEFLKVNEEFPPCPEELFELVTAPVNGSVNLGIGGGFVTVRRVA